MPRLQSPIARVRGMMCGEGGFSCGEGGLPCGEGGAVTVPFDLKSPVTAREAPPPAYEAITHGSAQRVSLAYARGEKGALGLVAAMGEGGAIDEKRWVEDEGGGATESAPSAPLDEAAMASAPSASFDEAAPPRAAVHGVPPEVLVDVFAATAALRRESPSSTSTPLLLSHVCRRWRDIALSAPELWTCIDIALSTINSHTLNGALETLALHQACSGTRALDVRLDIHDVLAQDAARLLAAQLRLLLSRVRLLEAPATLLPHLGAVVAPALERLHITGRALPDLPDPTIAAPRLHTVHTAAPACAALPWARLTALRCTGAPTLAAAQDLVAACAALRALTLDAPCAGGQDVWRARATLPAGLRTLALRCWPARARNARMLRSVLASCVFPDGLEALDIGPTDAGAGGHSENDSRMLFGKREVSGNVPWAPHAWSSLVRRSRWAPGLRSLTLRHVAIRPSELCAVLGDLPGLRTLAVWLPVEERWASGELVPHEDPFDDSVLRCLRDMPDLRSVEVEGRCIQRAPSCLRS
ncbi:hypothetical protein HDZ31DRAFT_71711 [Schizophyllum fasciatum]